MYNVYMYIHLHAIYKCTRVRKLGDSSVAESVLCTCACIRVYMYMYMYRRFELSQLSCLVAQLEEFQPRALWVRIPPKAAILRLLCWDLI